MEMRFHLQKIISSTPFFWISNIFLAGYAGHSLLYINKGFFQTINIPNMLTVSQQILIVSLFIVRKNTRQISTSLYDWACAISTILVVFLIQPVSNPHPLWIATWIQLSGSWIQLFSFLSLNRSFGIVPANRGIKQNGMYRFVRHPLYLGYIINAVGATLNRLNQHNVLVLLAFAILCILRLYNEERFLSQDKIYRAYRCKTRWKLVPFVF